MRLFSGRGTIAKGDVFIFPKGEDLTAQDLKGFLMKQRELYNKHYKRNYDVYVAKHKILKSPDTEYGENNKLVVGMPRLLVDEYAGYFGGNPVVVKAEEDSVNETIQEWLKETNFEDEHTEVIKSVAIYGRSYLLEYQDENGRPQIAHVEPDEGFMIYDDTIKSKPLAFVRYYYDNDNQPKGTIYYAGKTQDFYADKLQEVEGSFYKDVPAQEFYANEERQGIFDGAMTLIDALDNAVSRKANQVDYFDNAYLVMLGLALSSYDEETGKFAPPSIDALRRLIYSPDQDSVNAKIEFIQKPDGDNIQENLINRLTDLIYQTSMIPNFKDEAFGGNSSGVALQFKLLPMQNLAAFQERKFTNALRSMFKAVLESADGGQLKGVKPDEWKRLEFQFTRNIPANIADAVSTAVQASSLLSQETAIGMIPTVSDPKAEMKRKQEEQTEQMKQALNTSVPDYLNVGVEDETAEDENTEE